MNLKLRIALSATILLASTITVMLTSCSQLQLLNATVSHRGYDRTTDLAYGPDARQKLDIYQPQNAMSNAPVVIFFYGGSWRNGSKTDYRFVAKALTSRGFITVLPDYRLYPAVTFPKFVEDGAAAVRWVCDHIGSYGGDTNRIYLMGHSAGSHIAALLTLNPGYLQNVGLPRKAIRATATLSGPYDFVPNPWDRPVFSLPANSDFIDPNIEPITFVDGKAPPMLLVQGLRDKIVSPSNTTNLVTRIRSAGGQVDFIFYPNRGHAAVVVALVPPYQWLAPVLKDVTDYFNAH
jgi:acetyl esterase/lipase